MFTGSFTDNLCCPQLQTHTQSQALYLPFED